MPDSRSSPDRRILDLPDEQLLRLIGRIARKNGSRSFLVGGPVRDALLGRSGPDIDIAVESSPDRIGRALARRFNGRFVYHRRFLTGTVTLADRSHIDIARTRTETYRRPAALPSVKPAPVEEDLVRRDFTINALALELTPGSYGVVVDPHSGRRDLADRVVRVLHSRSFADDPTRAFRAIRFAIRLGFEIEAETLRLMRQAIRSGILSRLSAERVLYELRLISAEPLVLRMVEALLREKLLHASLDWQPRPRFLPRLQRLVAAGADPELVFIFLMTGLPGFDRVPVTAAERDAALAVRGFGDVRERLRRASRPSTIHRLLRQLPTEALGILSATESDPVVDRIRLYLDRLADVRISVDGRQLRSLGLKPGPKYREILDRILAARLDGKVTTRSQELALARELTAGTGRKSR